MEIIISIYFSFRYFRYSCEIILNQLNATLMR